jgi:hypothetical protein
MAGKRGMRKIPARKKARIIAEVRAGATSTEINEKYAVGKATLDDIKRRNGVKVGDGVPEIKANIWNELVDAIKREKLDTALIQTLKDFSLSDNACERNEAVKRILEVLKNAQPPKHELDINIQIKALVGSVINVIGEYVPKDRLGECVDRLNGICND